MPDILITEDIKGAPIDDLATKFEVDRAPDIWRDPESLAARIRNCRALIVRNQTQVTLELLVAATRLVVVGRAGIGLDNIDIEAASRRRVVVTYAPEQNAISVAEFCIGLMLSLVRMIPRASYETRNGRWDRQSYIGSELHGKTLGIIGIGRIGQLTARRALAFGMKIIACDPFIDPESVAFSELNTELVSLEDLLARADIVSCSTPATPQTKGLLNADRLKRMKKSAFLINTSRGEILEESGLVQVLQSRSIAGAALDVRECEPPVAAELERLSNVILTPHIAAFTREAQSRVLRAVCRDVSSVLEGKRAQNAVNGWVMMEAHN